MSGLVRLGRTPIIAHLPQDVAKVVKRQEPHRLHARRRIHVDNFLEQLERVVELAVGAIQITDANQAVGDSGLVRAVAKALERLGQQRPRLRYDGGNVARDFGQQTRDVARRHRDAQVVVARPLLVQHVPVRRHGGQQIAL